MYFLIYSFRFSKSLVEASSFAEVLLDSEFCEIAFGLLLVVSYVISEGIDCVLGLMGVVDTIPHDGRHKYLFQPG